MRGALKIRNKYGNKMYIAKILPGQRFVVFYWGIREFEALYTKKGKVLIFNGEKLMKSFPNARNFKKWNYKNFIGDRPPVINLGMGYSDIVILEEDWAAKSMSDEDEEDWYYEIKK